MILFCAEDAGPAQNLSILISGMMEPRCAVYAGPVAHGIFRSNGIDSFPVSKPYKAGEIDAILRKIAPHLVVTGTSWGKSLEKYVILAARKIGARTISIVEFWSWYAERFRLGDEDAIPDHIIVNDLTAKEEAILEGLPADRIYPLGNLALERMAGEDIRTVPEDEWRRSLGLPGKDIVAFISEDYTKVNSDKKDSPYGFDEHDVIGDILGAARQDQHILIKLHPSENKNKYDRLRGERVTVSAGAGKGPLIAYPKFFIGMGSMLLMEAALHRRDVVSYRPGEKKGFIGNKFGVTCPVKDKESLGGILSGAKKISNKDFKDRFNGSFERIADFIRKNTA